MNNLPWKTGWVLGAALLTCASVSALDGIVIVNESVAASSLDAGALKDIYAGKTMYWESGQAIVIVVAGDKTDAALQEASGMGASQFKTHWQRLGFSGRGQPPKKADDVEKAIALVSSTKGAIAIVPAGTDAKGVKKIAIK